MVAISSELGMRPLMERVLPRRDILKARYPGMRLVPRHSLTIA